MKTSLAATRLSAQPFKILPLVLLLIACSQKPNENFFSLENAHRKDALKPPAVNITSKTLPTEPPLMQSKSIPSSENLSLIDAWQAAKTHAAAYQVAKYARNAAQEPEQQAKAHLLPQLSLNGNYSNRAQDDYERYQSYGINLQVAQPIYDASRWRQYQAEKMTTQIGEAQLKQQEDTLLLEVAQAYFAVLTAQEKLSALAKEKATYQAQIAQAEGSFTSGQATVLDILEAKSHYDAAASREISLQTELTTAQNTLENDTGLSVHHLTPVDSLDFLTVKTTLTEEQWLNKALEHNTTLKQKALELEKAIADKKTAESEYYPQLSLTAGYQDNRNHIKAVNREAQHNRNKGGYVGLQFYLPIYSGGETNSKVRQQNAYIQQKEAEYRAEKGKISLEVKQQFALLKGYQAQIKAQKQLYQTNLEKVKAAKLGTQYGMSYPLEILQAEKDLAEANSSLAEAKYQYLLTEIRLLLLSGEGSRLLSDE
ncbi:TolC family protein [Suttonella ornithocola]|uniref:Outer membrane protein tolC n=1 Tax=Suttonella ornithocola TaxID=279832 RepID=A0A380MZ54_9GAMM|nr:TolC family protein [Suttonella ornithocola]SUO97183.1 Outer membrane protein tolC precursor [Suttonella ornithocola]